MSNRPQLIRLTNGSDNERALDELNHSTPTSELIKYKKNVALSTIILHTSPFWTSFKLLKQAFAKFKY